MIGDQAKDEVVRRSLVFGRRQGHKLRPKRQALVRKLLPEIKIDLERSFFTLSLSKLLEVYFLQERNT